MSYIIDTPRFTGGFKALVGARIPGGFSGARGGFSCRWTDTPEAELAEWRRWESWLKRAIGSHERYRCDKLASLDSWDCVSNAGTKAYIEERLTRVDDRLFYQRAALVKARASISALRRSGVKTREEWEAAR